MSSIGIQTKKDDENYYLVHDEPSGLVVVELLPFWAPCPSMAGYPAQPDMIKSYLVPCFGQELSAWVGTTLHDSFAMPCQAHQNWFAPPFGQLHIYKYLQVFNDGSKNILIDSPWQSQIQKLNKQALAKLCSQTANMHVCYNCLLCSTAYILVLYYNSYTSLK